MHARIHEDDARGRIARRGTFSRFGKNEGSERMMIFEVMKERVWKGIEIMRGATRTDLEFNVSVVHINEPELNGTTPAAG